METIAALEEKLTNPSPQLMEDLANLDGDILILGVAGKMGVSLAKLATRAIKMANLDKSVIGVSRFSDQSMEADLKDHGVKTIKADLLSETNTLPEVENVIFMAGKKFGTTGQEPDTWAMNAYLPGLVAEKFKNSRIVVFSSGNIYPFVHYASGGAIESTPPAPVGEYAQSCLGRERIFQYFCKQHQIPMLIYRLNYAIDMRYGNLLEIGKMVFEDRVIDLRNGHMNVIWQGDANEIALRALLHTQVPAKILNVTGPETISIQQVGEIFGKIFNKQPKFIHEPAEHVLLNNAGQCHRIFGYPRVSLLEMIEMTATWIKSDGYTINKPTHFQERSGKY